MCNEILLVNSLPPFSFNLEHHFSMVLHRINVEEVLPIPIFVNICDQWSAVIYRYFSYSFEIYMKHFFTLITPRQENVNICGVIFCKVNDF